MNDEPNYESKSDNSSTKTIIFFISTFGLLISSILIGGFFSPYNFLEFKGIVYGFFTSVFGIIVLFGIYLKFKTILN